MAQLKVRIIIVLASFLSLILISIGIYKSSPYPGIFTVVMLVLVYVFVYSQAHPINYLQPGRIYELVHYDDHGQPTKLVVFKSVDKKRDLVIASEAKFEENPQIGQKFLAQVNYQGSLVLCAVEKN